MLSLKNGIVRSLLPVAAALGVSACGNTDADAGSSGASASSPQRAPIFMATTDWARELCGLNRVELSPNGRSLLAWRAVPPSELAGVSRAVIVTEDCFEASDPACGTTLKSLNGLQAIGWSLDSSRVFARSGTSIVELGSAVQGRGFRMIGAAETAIPRSVRLDRRGASGSASAEDEARALAAAYETARRDADRGDVIRLVSVGAGDSAAWLASDRAGRLTVRDGTRRAALPSDMTATVYRDIELGQGGQGVFAYESGWADNVRRAAYERPMFDPKAGGETGGFDLKGVKASGESEWLAVQATRYLADNPSFVLSDIVGPGETHGAAIVSDLSSQTRLVRFTRDQAPDVIGCKRSPDTPATPPTEWRVVDIGSPDRGTLVNSFTAPTPPADRKLAIFFHGGPVTSMAEGKYLNTVQHYRRLGFDVVAVDATGSSDIGPEAIDRLVANAPAALTADVAAVAEYVTRRPTPYEQIVVHGESFGAAQAVMTARRLDADALVLVAPWLLHRDPAEWIAGRGAAARLRGQAAWETALFGTRASPRAEAFRAWMKNLAEGSDFRSSTLLVFAAQDGKSRPADVTPGSADVQVIPAANHTTIASHPATWRAIGRHLATLP